MSFSGFTRKQIIQSIQINVPLDYFKAFLCISNEFDFEYLIELNFLFKNEKLNLM